MCIHLGRQLDDVFDHHGEMCFADEIPVGRQNIVACEEVDATLHAGEIVEVDLVDRVVARLRALWVVLHGRAFRQNIWGTWRWNPPAGVYLREVVERYGPREALVLRRSSGARESWTYDEL
jgi:hypothetical protein